MIKRSYEGTGVISDEHAPNTERDAKQWNGTVTTESERELYISK